MLFKDGKLVKGVKIDMDITSFNQFIQAVIGQVPAGIQKTKKKFLISIFRMHLHVPRQFDLPWCCPIL